MCVIITELRFPKCFVTVNIQDDKLAYGSEADIKHLDLGDMERPGYLARQPVRPELGHPSCESRKHQLIITTQLNSVDGIL